MLGAVDWVLRQVKDAVWFYNLWKLFLPNHQCRGLRRGYSVGQAGWLGRVGWIVKGGVEGGVDCEGGKRGSGKTHHGSMTAQLQALLDKKVQGLLVVGSHSVWTSLYCYCGGQAG